MKFVKKLTALFLAVCMVMAMGITAFAADAATYTISAKSDDTHTYKVYQVFTGDLADGVLSNIKGGKNYNGSDAAGDAEKIAALTGTDQQLANAIAAYVDLEGEAYGEVTSTKNLTNVPAGYYLIKDEGKNDMTGDAYSTYIVKVVTDVEITPKKSVPTFEKKVQDINDTTDTAAGNLQDSADYDIGDNVPFTLTATVAANYADYTKYYFEFQDSMEESLTFDKNSVKVTIDGVEVSSDKYEVKTGTVTNGLGGDSFSVIFSDLKNTDATANSKVVVTYTAKLNEKAALGSQGNVNEAKLVYSNNPNDEQGGEHGETPWDTVIVFTYKVVVNKQDANKQPLTGATFTLSKKLKDGTTKEITAVKNDAGTQFAFSGLDDGDYVLTETETPSGYNTIDPITFTVKADHTIEWTTQARTDILTSLTGTKVSGEITLTPSQDKSTLSTDIVNKKGSELPSTGGMGTTVIYVAGIAMIVAAGVVVIARKRMA